MNALTRTAAQQALQEGRQRFNAQLWRTHISVFKVEAPLTVYIRASQCRVVLRYHALDQVELHARLYYAFGLQFVTEQDDAGVYIVAMRRRVLGRLSRAEFMLRVPGYTNLSFNLTPGAILVDELAGRVNLPPLPQTDDLTSLADPR